MSIIVSNPHQITIIEWPWKFICPSSRPGIRPYIVDWRNGKCDCKAGQCKHPCKHRRWVKEYAEKLWKQIIHRMTESQAGWELLRQIEAYVQDGGKE